MPRHIEIYIDDVPLSSVGPFIVQEVHEDPACFCFPPNGRR